MQLRNEILEGAHVRLEPQSSGHAEELWTVAQHPELWRYMPFPVDTRERFEHMVQQSLSMAAAGLMAQRA